MILIPASANIHRVIGSVERRISTMKQRLVGIKKANIEIGLFNIKAAVKLLIYQHRICKH